MSPRDSQRQRLYTAEREALAKHPLSPLAQRTLALDLLHEHGYRYASVASTQAYVDALRASAVFQRRWGYKGLSVTHNPSGSRGGHGVLQMSAQHRKNEWAILHEVAHNLSDFYSHAGHGPEFAATYLTLVKAFMGAEAAAALRESFAKHKVRYRSGLASVPKPSAARLERARRVKVRKAKPTVAIEETAARAAVQRREERRRTPMTYEQSYESGWRSSSGDMSPSLRIQMRLGFDHDAWTDGYLDNAAGREKYHLRGCMAHYNAEGGCGVA